MNRRQILVATAMLPLAPALVGAQSAEEQLADQLLAMWTTQDWASAPNFIAEDFQPLYPLTTSLPGRDALIQRQATSSLYTSAKTLNFVKNAVATTGDTTLVWTDVEIGTYDARTIHVPLLVVFKSANGMITAMHYMFDSDVYYDQI